MAEEDGSLMEETEEGELNYKARLLSRTSFRASAHASRRS